MTHQLHLSAIATAAWPLLVLLVLRLAPIVAFVCITSASSRTRRLAAGAAFALVFAVAWRSFGPIVLVSLIGLGYYACLTLGLYFFLPLVRQKQITKGALLLLASIFFLLLPAVAAPGLSGPAFLIVGFDATLSFYSYAVEYSNPRFTPTRADCLMFVLVDPTIVVLERSRRVAAPALNVQGVLRILLGIAGLVLAVSILAPLSLALSEPAPVLLEIFGRYGVIAVFAIVKFVTEYAKHSGLASLQIGLMRQIGYVTPERYAYPILATTPLDFWRRWNIYLGQWVKRYLYWPLALRIGRIWRRMPSVVVNGSAALVAFIAVGAMHVAYGYTESFRLPVGWLLWFTFHGVFMVAWAGAQHYFGARVPRAAMIVSAAGRACFLGMLFFSVGYW